MGVLLSLTRVQETHPSSSELKPVTNEFEIGSSKQHRYQEVKKKIIPSERPKQGTLNSQGVIEI